MARVTKEKFKTYGNVFDQWTNHNLFRLSSRGHFTELKSTIALGKEANIFSAEKEDGSQVIVKIYRLETCDFKRMYDYIKMDPRYINLKGHKRKIIFAWAQREFRNLMKAREAGVKVPTPITCLDNIIVMEFIGRRTHSSQIKNDRPSNPEKFYTDLVRNMKRLHKAKLVHGDLSEFNILNREQKPVLIDFSQCSPTTAMNARELLERDCRNIARFFSKLGVKTDQEKLFKTITASSA